VNSAEAIVTLIELARGERRYSLESRETEEVLNIALALLSELAVACDRIDRLERVVAERTAMPIADLRAIDYTDGPAAQEREDAMNALIARVLRIRLDPRARNTQQT
jgi:Cu/Ag efflux pump CusA